MQIRFACCLVVIFLLQPLVTRHSTLLLCQSTDAAVGGQITDEQGRVVPGVSVVLTNLNTGVTYEAKTNGDGFYNAPNLPPGIYRANVTKDGFKSIVKGDIELHVQDIASINFQLHIGSMTETVTVEAGGLVINTTDASVSTVIDRHFVENLPLNGRSFNTLLQLTPGVVIAPVAVNLNSLVTPGQFSVAGQRTDSNNLSVDGVSANFGVGAGTGQGQAGTGNAQAFSAIGGTSSLVSVDALQEFRIETSSFAPEFGRAPGGQISLLTRSGTNNFHGAVFDYFRNTIMDANDWFANERGNPRAPEHHNDFGGVLGGPIWKDRTFFFASYEGARLDIPQTTQISVPSAYARSIAPPAVTPYVNAYPKPDDGTIVPGVFLSNFTGTYANRSSLDAGSIRIDHKLSDRFSIFGRYNDAPSQLIGRPPFDSLSEVQTTSVNTRTVTVGIDMALSSRTSNTVRVNYSSQTAGFNYSMDSFGGATPFDPSLILGPLSATQNSANFQALDGTPEFSIGPQSINRTKQINFVDGLSVAFGPHQLRFGADYRAIYLNVTPPQFGIDLFPPDIPDFVSGDTAGQLAFIITGRQTHARMRTQTLSLYAQDTWKISRRLTVTYGLRWEWAPPPSALGSTVLASWINTGDPSKVALGPAGSPLWATTYGNFAPRLGMAYSLDEKGSFVIRVGGGVFYDLSVGSSAQLATQFPNTNLNFAGGAVPIGDPTPLLPGPPSLVPPYGDNFGDAVYANDQRLRLPRSYQWNISVEKSFGNLQAISATFVGQAGRDLLRQQALNAPNANFVGPLILTRNDAYSNYDALQLQYRKPLSGRVQALLNYTWSHSLDNASNDYLIGVSSLVLSAANDYASADFDVRHSFSGAVTYAVPSVGKSGPLAILTKDWSLSPVIVVRTGVPFNATIPAPSVLGISFSRPDLVPGQPLYLYGAQCATTFQGLGVLAAGQSCPGGQGLNPAAFAKPSTPRQGTEPRNDIPGFGLTQIDLAIQRNFHLSDRLSLQLRGEAFNLINHPNFTNPRAGFTTVPFTFLSKTLLNNGLGGLNSLFQQGGPRSLQVSLRLSF